MTDPTTQPATSAPAPAAPAPAAPSLGRLALALSRAQGLFINPVRNREVTVRGQAKGSGKDFSYSFMYADLAAVMDVVRKPLSDNELAVVQRVLQQAELVFVETMLIHSSGELLRQQIEVGNVHGDVKDLGGRITYMRRYSLSAMLGIASEEDGDENPNAAQVRQEPRRDRRQRPAARDDGREDAQTDAGPHTEQREDSKPAKGKQWPWEVDSAWRPKYQSARHVWVRLAPDGSAVQADVGSLSTDELTGLEALIGKRQGVFTGKDYEGLRGDCARDLRLVSGELLARAGDTGDQPPVDPVGKLVADAVAQVEAEQEPLPAAVDTAPVTIAVDLTTDILRVTTALTSEEVSRLGYLEQPEVLGMILAPENKDLFDLSLAKTLSQFNESRCDLLTGDWLGQCWLRAMEADKKRRMPARRLARTALHLLNLEARDRDQAGGGRPARLATPAEHAAVTALALALAPEDAALKWLRFMGFRAQADIARGQEQPATT